MSIITDAYSHKIVGYKLHPTLAAEGAIDALIMAAKDEKKTGALIHHSDRGIQYYCTDYVSMIEHYGIRLSMTEKGDPYENAIAERVNGILKNEFLLNEVFLTGEAAARAVDNAATGKHLQQRMSKQGLKKSFGNRRLIKTAMRCTRKKWFKFYRLIHYGHKRIFGDFFSFVWISLHPV